MQKARRHTLSLRTIVLRPLVGTWFQVHFPPLAGVLPIFPSLYFSTIGRQVVFSLTEWSPLIQSGFHVTQPTQVPFGSRVCFHLRDCHPLWSDFPDSSVSCSLCNSHVKGPTTPQRKTSAVWAISRSLAATEEIDFSFFSCGY